MRKAHDVVKINNQSLQSVQNPPKYENELSQVPEQKPKQRANCLLLDDQPRHATQLRSLRSYLPDKDNLQPVPGRPCLVGPGSSVSGQQPLGVGRRITEITGLRKRRQWVLSAAQVHVSPTGNKTSLTVDAIAATPSWVAC